MLIWVLEILRVEYILSLIFAVIYSKESRFFHFQKIKFKNINLKKHLFNKK